jgi:hypothetical protein
VQRLSRSGRAPHPDVGTDDDGSDDLHLGLVVADHTARQPEQASSEQGLQKMRMQLTGDGAGGRSADRPLPASDNAPVNPCVAPRAASATSPGALRQPPHGAVDRSRVGRSRLGRYQSRSRSVTTIYTLGAWPRGLA